MFSTSTIGLLLLATATIGLLVVANIFEPTHIHQSLYILIGRDREGELYSLNHGSVNGSHLIQDATEQKILILGRNLRPSDDSSSVPHYVVLDDSKVMNL